MHRREADRSLLERLANTRLRLLRAVEDSMQIVATSRRLLQDTNRLRRDPAHIVWASPDDTIVCRLIARGRALHEVEVTVREEVAVIRVFHDPVEAADECSTLRKLFLDTDARF